MRVESFYPFLLPFLPLHLPYVTFDSFLYPYILLFAPFKLFRSFYKHVLGNPVDYTDLEAIEPEIFKSLKQILKLRLDDLGLDLTFSAESLIFGKHEVQSITVYIVVNDKVYYATLQFRAVEHNPLSQIYCTRSPQ